MTVLVKLPGCVDAPFVSDRLVLPRGRLEGLRSPSLEILWAGQNDCSELAVSDNQKITTVYSVESVDFRTAGDD